MKANNMFCQITRWQFNFECELAAYIMCVCGVYVWQIGNSALKFCVAYLWTYKDAAEKKATAKERNIIHVLDTM